MNIWLKVICLPVLCWLVMVFFVATYGEIWVNRSGFDEWLVILCVIGSYWVVMGIYGKFGHYLKRQK